MASQWHTSLKPCFSEGMLPPDGRVPLDAILERIRDHGLPNFYGPQRFWPRRRNFCKWAWQRRVRAVRNRLRNPFSGKSWHCRPHNRPCSITSSPSVMRDGFLRRILPGDVMCKIPFGGMFVASDVEAEQRRFDAREIVSAGPIFGP